MTNLQKIVQNTQNQLDILKKNVIGIFRIYNINHFVFEYNINSDYIYCLSITTQGAISELHIPKVYGVYRTLPEEYNNLYDLLQDPFAYEEWIKTIS